MSASRPEAQSLHLDPITRAGVVGMVGHPGSLRDPWESVNAGRLIRPIVPLQGGSYTPTMTPLPRLRIKRLTDTAVLPRRGTPHSSGLDVYADLGGDGQSLQLGVLPTLVSTGLALEIPVGYEVQVRPRSGLSRQGVDVAFGTVDADYRGELKVNMAMRSGLPQAFAVQHGDRIAQIVVAPVPIVEIEEVESLSPTVRGEGGFGSTGR